MAEGIEGNAGVGPAGAAPLVPLPVPPAELIALTVPRPVTSLRLPNHFRLVADEL